MQKSENSLKRCRKAKGLTLQRLSMETGIPPSTINNFENGQRGIDDDALEKICDFLGVRVAEVMQPPAAPSWPCAVREAAAMYSSMSVSDQISQLARTLGVQESKVKNAIAEILVEREGGKKKS